jgi:hypothetical protein
MTDAALRTRLGELVGAVARQALADRGARQVALLDDGGPEAALAAELLASALDPDAVVRVAHGFAEMEPLLRAVDADAGRVAEEARRMRARLVDDAVLAHPASKTVLLLAERLPPEPFLPLGDVYASEVARLTGGWSAPAAVRALAEEAGGVEALDAALARWLEARDPAGLDALPPTAAARVRAAFTAGRAERTHPRTVPKLGRRTLFADLWE